MPRPARSERVAAVMFETNQAEGRRLGVGADAVIRAHRTSEREPEPAGAALLGPPLVTVIRGLLTPIAAGEPSLMEDGAEGLISVGSTGRLF